MQSPQTEIAQRQTGHLFKNRLSAALRHMKQDRQLLLMFIPCIVFFVIFRYGPLYGLVIAFKDYSVFAGVGGSEWVGLEHFERFFSGPDFLELFRNTLLLGLYTLMWGFPFPILFAIMLNEVRQQMFKKTIQTMSMLPAFLSVVVVTSMTIDFLSPSHGLVNEILETFGFERKYFLVDPEWFRTIYVGSEIWNNMGYEAVIYLAAIASVDPSLYEAAKVDGATRVQMMRYITLPSILPTITVMFILKTGSIIRVGYEKVLLLQNPMIIDVADVFSTYVYRKGLLESNFSYATAVGLFENIIAFIMLMIANTASRKYTERSLW